LGRGEGLFNGVLVKLRVISGHDHLSGARGGVLSPRDPLAAVAGVPTAAPLAGLPPPPPDGDGSGVAIPMFLANALLLLQAHRRP